MTDTKMTPRDNHHLLREAITDSVEGAEHDASAGRLKLRNGTRELTLTGPPQLVIDAVGEARSQANGHRATQHILDGILRRLTRATSRHGPHGRADLITVEIGSSPNRLAIRFSTTAAAAESQPGA